MNPKLRWFVFLSIVSAMFSLINYFLLMVFGFTKLTVFLVSEVPAAMAFVIYIFTTYGSKRRVEE